MESNVGGFNYPNKTHAQVYASTFCSDARLNCSAGGKCDAACLRAADAQAVMGAWDTATGNVVDFVLTDLGHILDGLLGTGPVVDGAFLAAEPQEAVESGAYWAAGMPVLLGTNTNEGETFIYDGVPALPNFLAPLAYTGIFGFDEKIAADIDAQPRYNYSQCEYISKQPLVCLLTFFSVTATPHHPVSPPSRPTHGRHRRAGAALARRHRLLVPVR